MSIQIESDLAKILEKIDDKLDNLDRKFEQKLDNLDRKFEQKLDNLDRKFEQKLDNLDSKFEQKLDKLSEDVTDLKVGIAEVKGEIETLDTKVDGLDKRVSNQEFTNRGVLVGLIVVILGGAAKFFGIIGNP